MMQKTKYYIQKIFLGKGAEKKIEKKLTNVHGKF